MPKGKGTYGSQVGRPTKKDNNYEGGGIIAEIGIPSPQEEFPVSDASQRMEIYQEGGLINPRRPTKL